VGGSSAEMLLYRTGGGGGGGGAVPWALEISSFLGPRWHSPIGSMPFHSAQKTPGPNPLPLALVIRISARIKNIMHGAVYIIGA
jgi:hypothetical protein